MSPVVVVVALALLALAAAAGLARLVAGPTVPDRIVALDNLLLVLTAAIAVGAVAVGGGAFLGVLVAVALLGFVGSVTVARFVERRGGR